MIPILDAEFARLKAYLHEACGIDVPRDKRYLFVTRLGELLHDLECSDFSTFYHRLTHNEPTLRHRLIEAMTTNETSFFRDGHPFEALVAEILPALARRRVEDATHNRPRIRVCSVGCSTGEEPYSVAICLSEWLDGQRQLSRQDVSVLAVDISTGALAQARRGVYRPEQLNKVPASYRKRWFCDTAAGVRVKDEIRAMVVFSEVNLVEPVEHLGRFDLILCRNVIIYFSATLRRQLLERFHTMLNPGGVLLLGTSEGLYSLCDRFRVAYCGPTMYYLKEQCGPTM